MLLKRIKLSNSTKKKTLKIVRYLLIAAIFLTILNLVTHKIQELNIEGKRDDIAEKILNISFKDPKYISEWRWTGSSSWARIIKDKEIYYIIVVPYKSQDNARVLFRTGKAKNRIAAVNTYITVKCSPKSEIKPINSDLDYFICSDNGDIMLHKQLLKDSVTNTYISEFPNFIDYFYLGGFSASGVNTLFINNELIKVEKMLTLLNN